MKKDCCAPGIAGKAAAFDADELALLCKALGHPARVQLLRHLAQHGECYFGSLADVVALAPSTISQHMSILKDAGLVSGSADEQRTCYCINPRRLQQLKGLFGAL